MSPSLLNLVPNAVGQGHAQIVYAEVTAPAPNSFHDPLYVVLPDWSTDFPLALLEWPAVHGQTLPLPGDAVLLINDSRGSTRCVWWDGQMTFATQTSLAYYLTTTASDVAAHTKITSAAFSPKTEAPFAALTNGQTLLDYMTEPGQPGVTFLPAGQYEFHIHARQKAGNQTVQIFAEFWEYDPDTAAHVGLIGTTQVSQALTATEVEYRLFFANDEVYTFASAKNRIAVHVRVIVGGTGGASIICFVGGTADSHVVVPSPAPAQVASSAWVTPTSLLNSWTNVGGAFETAAYLKDPLGFVHLKGAVTGGASGTAVFPLPVGFRPGATTFDAAPVGSLTGGAIEVSSVGNVTAFYSGGTTSVGLSSVTFLAEN